MKFQKTLSFLNRNKEIVGYFVQNYLLSHLEENIFNDLGASHTSITRKKNRILKKANPSGEKKLRDEILWVVKFSQTPFNVHLPKIYNYSVEPGNVFIEMKYYNYPNLRKIILENSEANLYLKKRWATVFKVLSTYFFTKQFESKTPEDYVQKVHVKKLKERLSALKNEHIFKKILRSPHIHINGEKKANVASILPLIEKNKRILNRLTPPRVFVSHGDVHTNNILCGIQPDSLIFLDCRGKSPGGSDYFDPAYDIAKILHDVHSYYSIIERHGFTIFYFERNNEIGIDYDIVNTKAKERFDNSYDIVQKQLKKLYDKEEQLEYRSEFTEAMHYLTMVPFHMKKQSEGLMCYATGVNLLNNWLKKYHPTIYAEAIGKKK